MKKTLGSATYGSLTSHPDQAKFRGPELRNGGHSITPLHQGPIASHLLDGDVKAVSLVELCRSLAFGWDSLEIKDFIYCNGRDRDVLPGIRSQSPGKLL